MNLNLIWHARHDPHHQNNQIPCFKAGDLGIPAPAIAPFVQENVLPVEDKTLIPLVPLGAKPHMTKGVP